MNLTRRRKPSSFVIKELTMPLSDLLILKLAQPPLTNQTIADFALLEDQARRRAIAAGRDDDANEYDTETARLCAQLKG